MKTTLFFPMTAAALALLAASSGTAQSSDPVAAPPAAAQEQLSDERVMELASGYLVLMHDREWEQLWEHVSPEGRENFGTLEQFRTSGSSIMDRLGTPVAVDSEAVEPARAGMLADRLYIRHAYYSGVEGRRVRVLVGLMKDGSIAGMQIQPVQ